MKKEIYDNVIRNNLPNPYKKIHIFERGKNYVLNFHSHEDVYHINYVVEGQLELYYKDRCFTVLKNHLFVVPPGISHKIVSETGYKQIGCDIKNTEDDDRNISKMLDLFFGFSPSVPLSVPVLKKSYDEFDAMMKTPTPLNILQMTNIFECLITDGMCLMSNAKFTITSRLAKIIEENDPFKLTLNDICKMIGYSKTQTERLANKELGCGITTYLNNLKLQKICTLLQYTDKSIEEIAQETGMYDASHLITFFKRNMKITPGKYRKNNITH